MAQTPVKSETLKQPLTVVGLTVRTNNAREAGPQGEIGKLWARLMQNGLLEQIPERLDRRIVAVYSNYASDQNGDYDYTLGALVSHASKIPAGFSVTTIAPGKYAVMLSEPGPPPEVVPALWRHVWNMTPQELGGRRAFRSDYEIYPGSGDRQKTTVELHLGLSDQPATRK